LAVQGENNVTQTFGTTDSHAYWVVTDKPDLSRTARDVVEENGVILQHENLDATENGFYVEAKNLRVGDTFIGPSGELTTFIDSQRVDYPDGITVYNFTVEDDHNYFVIANYEAFQHGAQPVLVHNANETLYRQGLDRESVNRLSKKSAEAEEKIGIHGISVSARPTNIPSVSANRQDIEEHFIVHDTPSGSDSLHKTIELPKPITDTVAKLFNSLFGRK
jgi:hypothetical protein